MKTNKENILSLARKEVPMEFRLTRKEIEILSELPVEQIYNYGFHVGDLTELFKFDYEAMEAMTLEKMK